MTATDYTESTLYRRREQEMNLRNERRRAALERQLVRPTIPSAGPRGGLARGLRHRLLSLVTGAPARG